MKQSRLKLVGVSYQEKSNQKITVLLTRFSTRSYFRWTHIP